jgi:ribosomal protein S27E
MNDAEFIASLTAQLADGWEERIEYQVSVKRHVTLCQLRRSVMSPARQRHYECECPQGIEARARTVQLPSLMDQLQEAVAEPVSIAGGDGASGDKPHSKAPGNQEALDLLLSVKQDAYECYTALRRAFYPTHAARGLPRVVSALRALPDWCAMANESGYEQVVCDVKEILRKRVRSARIILGYDTRQSMLADVVCGDCGGALIVADDASTDVRCIGTPDAAPCGNRYFRWDWINLLEGEGA